MLILSVFLLPLVAAEPKCETCEPETSLLQKPKESIQLSQATAGQLVAVPGWSFAGLGSCDPTTISTHSSVLDAKTCAALCSNGVGAPDGSPAATGFSYQSSKECNCCFGIQEETAANPATTPFVYVLADPFWTFFAAGQRCLSRIESSDQDTLASCASSCEGKHQWLVYGPGPSDCYCCDRGLAPVAGSLPGGLGYQLDPPITYPQVAGWSFQGRRWDCDGVALGEIPMGSTPLACAGYCASLGDSVGAMVIDQNEDRKSGMISCKCCDAIAPEAIPSSGAYAYWREGAKPKSTVAPATTTVAPATSTAAAPAGTEETKETAESEAPVQKIAEPGTEETKETAEPEPSAQKIAVSGAAAAGSSSVVGDPHITALDGSHYLLLSEGTFSLWHLHGLSTEIQSEDGAGGGFKKVPVEWEVYTHYSGQQSFTKGLLLVDRSAGVQRQFLEITSQDCQWRARSGEEWSLVSEPGMISADGQDYVTGFNMTKTGGHGRNQLNLNSVHFSMNSKDGATDIAVLTVSCRPKRNLNLNFSMKRRSDHQFVEGELAGRKKLATLQTSRSDAEFSIRCRWQEMGGSAEAEAYLRQMDEDSSSKTSLLQICNAEDKVQAKITCSKYLASLEHLDPSGFFLNDCMYDVCHGAGEDAAELAAELLMSTATA